MRGAHDMARRGGCRPLLVVGACLAMVVGSACGDSAQPPDQPVTWTGARALTGKEDAPSGVVTDGSRVFFTTGRTQVGENALRVVALDGESTSRVVAVTPGGLIPNGHLAIDGDVVYVDAGNGIVRQPIAGGDGIVVVQGRPALIDGVVVTGDELWWTTYQYGEPDRIEFARMPKSGGPVEVLAVDVAGGLDDPHPDGDSALVASPRGVLRVRSGGAPEVVVSSDVVGGAVSHLATDDERLYVLTAGSRHRLLAIPRTGGAPVELADDVDDVATLAVVGDEVVFFGRSGGIGSGGRESLLAVPRTGGDVRVVASGRYPDGDLAAVGDGRVVFSADFKVWIATVSS